MTLCLAFKDQDAVYLLADSAVSQNREVPVGYSTFGELEISGPGFSVREAALKILRWGDVAATFSGDANVGYEVFENFITASKARPTREAFEIAWTSSLTPGMSAKITALLAFYDGGPQLIKFGEGLPFEGAHFQSACIGNVDADSAQFFQDAVNELPPLHDSRR